MASMTDYMILHDVTFERSTSPSGPRDAKKLEFDLPAGATSAGFHHQSCVG